jgi:hypothetical protein
MRKTSKTLARCVTIPAFILVMARTCPVAGADQATGLRAFHRAGQTFITWREVDAPALDDAPAVQALRERVRADEKAAAVRYHIYRSDRPIASVGGAQIVAVVRPFSCWNLDYHGDPRPEDRASRYIVEEGAPPLAAGTGLYVHNPKRAGAAYYAVTLERSGTEATEIGAENSLREPVKEIVGQGAPVLQRTVRPKDFQYVETPTLHYFVRWEAPPNASVENKPFDYVVAVPPSPATPAPVGIHLHCWGGSLNGGYGWWYNAEKGSLLLASNQIPYDWWTGYHDRYFDGPRDKESWRGGTVRPYSQRRMLSFLDWMATRWDVDLARTYVAGSSMGGSGAPMLAIRYPDRIAWAISWVGIHTPARSPQFKGSYAQVFGEPDWLVRFEDDTPVWDYYDDVWYLKRYPEKEVGLILFSNGKNDGGIGWPQAAAFFRTLQETRRPHVFVWGQGGHGERARMPVTLDERVLPIDVRTDQSLPAFTNSTLDDNPGSGDPDDGDQKGQANLYLFWETRDIVDAADRWEMTVGVCDKAPADSCTVDITPRRLQRFKPARGAAVRWTATGADGGAAQSGRAAADGNGLVTLPRVRVTKGKTRVALVAP